MVHMDRMVIGVAVDCGGCIDVRSRLAGALCLWPGDAVSAFLFEIEFTVYYYSYIDAHTHTHARTAYLHHTRKCTYSIQISTHTDASS